MITINQWLGISLTSIWVVLGCATAPVVPEVSSTVEDQRESLVVDMHVDTLWQIHKHGWRFDQPDPRSEVDPKRLRKGGVDAQFFALWMPPTSEEPNALAHHLLDLFEKEILGRAPGLALARSPAEIRQVHGEGKVAALLGLEGCVPLEGDVERIEAFVERGIRYVSLTWNESNPFGDGAKGNTHGGLTEKGRALVAWLNDHGVMVDLSHAAETTFWDVISVSTRPVIASHSNARALRDHPRNLDDLQLWALAESGGFVGLNFHSSFLRGDGERATIADVVAHARHMAAVMGPDHIGLGSDFDGGITAPADLRDVAALPRLRAALEAAGFDSESIALLFGENAIRAFERTEQAASIQPVSHRPAKAHVVESSSPGGEALIDHSTLTAWEAPLDGSSLPFVELEFEGPGIDRLGVCGSSPQLSSGVREVEISVRSSDSSYTHQATLKLGGDVRPYRLKLPGAERESRLIVRAKLTKVDTKAGASQLTEIFGERRGTP